MKRLLKILQNYLIFALPAVVAIMIWGSLQSEKQIESQGNLMLHGLWEVLGWNIMFWFAALIVYLAILVLVPSIREKTLTRLANLRERDEREELITGRAARSSYISTMSLLIFFLFLSIFTVNIRRNPPEVPGGHKGSVSLGLSFTLLDKASTRTQEEGVIFESSDIPVSKSAILLCVLIWQILSFSIPARRESNEALS